MGIIPEHLICEKCKEPFKVLESHKVNEKLTINLLECTKCGYMRENSHYDNLNMPVGEFLRKMSVGNHLLK